MVDDRNMEISVNNAGLVLIWPFVTRFFEQIDLLENGQFVDEGCRNRAVYLLQYLAYNRIDFPEDQLMLNKLFVGMPVQNYLRPEVKLTQAEIDLAKSLLNGLIINWEKLKESSIEAVQETFIQREGILRNNKKSTKLVIGKKGVDVLLDSLPWNISIIKLPWMEQTIFVEWI